MKIQLSRLPLLLRTVTLSGVFLLGMSSISQAQDLSSGIMDRPLFPATRPDLPSPAPPSPGQLIAIHQQRMQALAQEKQTLRQLPPEQLLERAKNGERAAQLILAETFATEANYQSLTVGAANAALGDAIYWYSLAARRGFPGAPPIEMLLPALPVQAIRAPR